MGRMEGGGCGFGDPFMGMERRCAVQVGDEMSLECRRRRRDTAEGFLMLWIVVFGVLCLSGVSGQAALPHGFVDEVVVDEGLLFPVDFCFLNVVGEERLIVAQKDGVVKLLVNGVIQPGLFLDLTDQTASFFDRGLVACAVDTSLKKGNPYVYFAYAYKGRGVSSEGEVPGRLSRFNVNDNMTKAIKSSEQVIVGSEVSKTCSELPVTKDIICCFGNSHCMGGLEMDSNGHLFVALGDGSIPNRPDEFTMRAQDLNALSGKLLRVNRDGTAVEGNPWYRDGRSKKENASKVWSLGLRQSFRIHLDEIRGIPLLAEVGWGTYEEVNWGERGANFQWPCSQGPMKNPQYAGFDACKNFPVAGRSTGPLEYYPRTVGKAVTSALRVNFPSWPREFRNKIFMVDFASNWMKYFRVGKDSQKKVGRRSDFGTFLNGPVQVRTAPKETLYYIAINSQNLRRIRFAPDNSRPEIMLSSPPEGAFNVETTANIELHFSKPMDGPTLGRNNITLKRTDGPGGKVKINYLNNTRTRVVTVRHFRPLESNASYKLTVENAKDVDGKIMKRKFVLNFTTGAGYSIYASDLEFISSENGLGPAERDMSNGGGGVARAPPIRIRTQQFQKGIGCAPLSRVRVGRPDDSCTLVQATVGVDDSSTNLDGGRLYFSVKTNLGISFSSKELHPLPLNRTSAPLDIVADVKDAKWVEFIVQDSGWGRVKQNLGSWGALRFRCGIFDALQPKVDRFSPADGASKVKVQNPVIQLKFNEPMDPSFALSGIRLRKVLEDRFEEIAWIPEVKDDSTAIRLHISSNLDYKSKYEIVATPELRDLAGNSLQRDYLATFTTRPPPSKGELIPVAELPVISVSGTTETFDSNATPVFIRNGGKTLSESSGTPVNLFNRGISLRTGAEVAYSVPKECSSIVGYGGVDPISGRNSCLFYISYESNGRLLRQRVVEPRDAPQRMQVKVKPGRIVVIGAKEVETGDKSVCSMANISFRCPSGDKKYLFIADETPVSVKGTVAFNGRLGRGGGRITLPPAASENTSKQIVAFKRGVKMQAWTTASYAIPGRCSRFLSAAGVDADKVDPWWTTRMQMRAVTDGRGAASCKTRPLTASSRAMQLSCDTGKGARTLSLRVSPRGRVDKGDFAIWGDPQLDCAPGTRAPTCEIKGLSQNLVVGDKLFFRGVAKDYLGNRLPKSAISWRLLQLHCGTDCHEHEPMVLNGTDRGEYMVDDHGDEFYFQVVCTACDGRNCASSSANTYPRTVELTVKSRPAGLVVTVGSGNGPAPFSRIAVIGAKVTVSALAEQDGRRFSHWAHDRSITDPRFEFVVRGARPRTFEAVFV